MKINNFIIPCDSDTKEYTFENLDYKLLFEIESGKFLDIIKKLEPAVSEDKARQHLNVINIRSVDDKIIFEATDGHKLLQRTAESKQDFESTNIHSDYFDCLVNLFEKNKIIKFEHWCPPESLPAQAWTAD